MVFFAFVLPVYREGFSGSILITMIALALLFILVLLFNELILLLVILLLGFLAYWLISKSFRNLALHFLSILPFFIDFWINLFIGI